MASQDETVSRACILQLLEHAHCDGCKTLFGVLEHQEPILAAYALASADLLAENLRRYRVPEWMIRRVHRDLMVAELVWTVAAALLTSPRLAHRLAENLSTTRGLPDGSTRFGRMAAGAGHRRVNPSPEVRSHSHGPRPDRPGPHYGEPERTCPTPRDGVTACPGHSLRSSHRLAR